MLLKRLLGFRPSDPFEPAALVPPLAAAAYSVLVLVAENPNSGIRAVNLLAPLLLSLLVAHMTWVASRSVSGDPHRRMLLSTGATVILLFFRYIAMLPGWFGDLLPLVSEGVAAGVLVVIAVGLSIVVVRSRRDFRNATRFVGVTAVLLVSFTAVRAALSMTGGPPPEAALPEEPDGGEFSAADSASADQNPDIFLILLDGYTGPSSLQEVYGLDIGDFLRELEALGFVVPRQSRANYVTTFMSFASMLDWQYLHERLESMSRERDAMGTAFSKLHDNQTTRLLKERGYEVVFFRSSYPPLSHSPVADIHVPRYAAADLELMWFRGTILPATIGVICELLPCGSGGLGFTPEPADIHQARFTEIASIPSSGRPLFVYAHVLLPHEPFLFDAECGTKEALLPSSVTPENEEEVRRAYRDQVACLNRMLLPLARSLIEDRERTPVVLFQSDHGFGRLGLGWSDTLEDADPQKVRERFDIFAAYYLPDGPVAMSDSITPINAFRSIFDHMFDLDLPLLADRSYWSNYDDDILGFSRYR